MQFLIILDIILLKKNIYGTFSNIYGIRVVRNV